MRLTGDNQSVPLEEVELGDVITVGQGKSLTVRAKAKLPVPVGTMGGFVICGEMETLLSIPSSPSEAVNHYKATSHIPPNARDGRSVCEGACTYWAPHLPALAGAMGEVLWRVVDIRGSIDPMVIVYQGNEMTVFVRIGEVQDSDLDVLYMRRDVDNSIAVTRQSGVVLPAGVPTPDYVPEHIKEPARQPARTL